jgi:phosphate starvation-inducible PhoH-like protein
MEETIDLNSNDEAKVFFGERDANLRLLRDALSVEVVARDTFIKLSGIPEKVKIASSMVAGVLSELRKGTLVTSGEVKKSLREKIRALSIEAAQDIRDYLLVPLRSEGQESYVRAIKDNTVVFCIGPAGTGKTYLAVMMALSMLRAGVVEKIVLVRPAVEAGEKLGFLPGDFQAKISPYLRPLYDALYDFLDTETVKRYKEKDIIEIVPLAYMRGRTLNRSFMILDEAQNTTSVQMKMFLTRLGMESRAVVTGDITQIDLKNRNLSGLVRVQRILKPVKGVKFVYMSKKDIVRHPIIERILEAYDRGQA